MSIMRSALFSFVLEKTIMSIPVKCYLLCVFLTNVFGSPILSDSNLLSPRVIGGIEASPHEFPFLVSLQWTGGHFCSGVIIRNDLILTAASCTEIMNDRTYLRVVAGRYQLNNKTEETISEQVHLALKITQHPNYPGGSSGHSNDIAMIKLTSTLKFNEAVGSIQLPSSAEYTISEIGTITGWGSGKEEEISLKDTLMKANIPIISDEKCKLAYGDDFEEEAMICAGYLEGGVDFCNGDTGGPLIGRNEDGTIILAGISSFGKGCGQPGFPGVYLEVSNFLDFIQQNS